jgi:hypothetical protein
MIVLVDCPMYDTFVESLQEITTDLVFAKTRSKSQKPTKKHVILDFKSKHLFTIKKRKI